MMTIDNNANDFYNKDIFFPSFFSVLTHSQRQIAMISEMIHCASLLHDDVIDQSDIRRGKPSVNVVWSQKKVSYLSYFPNMIDWFPIFPHFSISRNWRLF